MYLVTGASGFMGKFLVERLANAGEVIATGRSSSPFKRGVKYVKLDVSDREEVDRVFSEYRPDVVFHMAALMADACESNPTEAFRVNVRGTENLLEASSKYGAKRFVFASSISVYGLDVPRPVREEHAGKPSLLYGVTKYYGEMVGLWYDRKGLLEFRAVRPSVVFGPGRVRGPSSQYSSAIVDAALRGEKVVIRNPDDRVNYIYVRDAVEVTARLGEIASAPSKVYNAGGFSCTVMEFVEAVREIVPGTQYVISPSPSVKYVTEIDNTLAERELGWRPRFDLRKSIEDYVNTVKRGSDVFTL
ncbi:UDP-glucose 4-epimerase-like protein [Sulfodiicoccus acidiphilus]|uniref:UDP-glucose 4-epimerase-like protein n=1 Tax=Sulfodiicoccus acidiphilus TaxID=1670455 RepID=A0A348B512_9CREN|nr:NAD(P)-dependent oxidoreductase [Sulfodiicoccus acidiphilus]BBD73264.1 UDP-glucose 4-epimerase-like protein [Sulfodiicoccus acidiphilus]GGT89507.1 UDP-glucose 4-epimerase-like protein [Sulfodiicoccus acidiphilus]